MNGNTVFISYILIPSGLSTGSYSQPIHCNYIKKINLGTSDPLIQEVSLNFPHIDDFKFLNNSVSDKTGYTVNRIYALVQIVSNDSFNSFDEVTPDSTDWRKLNITNQVTGYSASDSWVLSGAELTSVVFKISLLQYYTATIFEPYDLTYLNYPSSGQGDELVFGDATYFFGNVKTTIKADVYTTDLNINIYLNEFNSTTNPTWSGLETVYITEVGIYDSNKNLVAIGKLNDPVAKDSTIARTILFNLDF